jgi:hypothetical protein
MLAAVSVTDTLFTLAVLATLEARAAVTPVTARLLAPASLANVEVNAWNLVSVMEIEPLASD